MLREIKVELGDFGRASALSVEAGNHPDFRYAAMALYVEARSDAAVGICV
jgi:hypothetical protein